MFGCDAGLDIAAFAKIVQAQSPLPLESLTLQRCHALTDNAATMQSLAGTFRSLRVLRIDRVPAALEQFSHLRSLSVDPSLTVADSAAIAIGGSSSSSSTLPQWSSLQGLKRLSYAADVVCVLERLTMRIQTFAFA